MHTWIPREFMQPPLADERQVWVQRLHFLGPRGHGRNGQVHPDQFKAERLHESEHLQRIFSPHWKVYGKNMRSYRVLPQANIVQWRPL